MNVKQQIAVANAQELIQVASASLFNYLKVWCNQLILQRLSDKCVRKCLQKPGQSLDKYEKVRARTNFCWNTPHESVCSNAWATAWIDSWSRGRPCLARISSDCRRKRARDRWAVFDCSVQILSIMEAFS
jgi:hypothetical protein